MPGLDRASLALYYLMETYFKDARATAKVMGIMFLRSCCNDAEAMVTLSQNYVPVPWLKSMSQDA